MSILLLCRALICVYCAHQHCSYLKVIRQNGTPSNSAFHLKQFKSLIGNGHKVELPADINVIAGVIEFVSSSATNDEAVSDWLVSS